MKKWTKIGPKLNQNGTKIEPKWNQKTAALFDYLKAANI